MSYNNNSMRYPLRETRPAVNTNLGVTFEEGIDQNTFKKALPTTVYTDVSFIDPHIANDFSKLYKNI